MKKMLVLFMLLAGVFAAVNPWVNWEEGDWSDLCTNEDYAENSFVIYARDVQYLEKSGLLMVKVEPKFEGGAYLPSYSSARFAENAIKIIPMLGYPSNTRMFDSWNYTFFLPVPNSGGKVFLRIVANNSYGEPKCREAEWNFLGGAGGDMNLSAEMDVAFDPLKKKFVFEVENKEAFQHTFYSYIFEGGDLREADSMRVDADDSLSWDGAGEYQSETASIPHRYTALVIAFNGTHSFYSYKDSFEFRDFNLTIPEVPQFRPGEEYSLGLLLNNTGSLPDRYTVTYGILNITSSELSTWLMSLTNPGQIEAGEEGAMTLEYSVPELQVGSERLFIRIGSVNSGINKTFTLNLEPQKMSNLVVDVRDIYELNAYDTNNLTLVIYASGTISPEVYYVVYTEPALMMRNGADSLTANVGEINSGTVEFDVGGSCGMSETDTAAFNSGRKLLMYSKMVYEKTGTMDSGTLEFLNNIYEQVQYEKLNMVSDNSYSLFSSAERFSSLLSGLIEGITDELGVHYISSVRENLYLFSADITGTLENTGERMAEDCSSVDEVNFYLYSFDSETFQYEESSKVLPVEGPKVIEFIGPASVKAISGTRTTFTYKLKNNAGENFEVEIVPDSDLISIRSSIFLRLGTSETIELSIVAPDYIEAEDLQSFVEIKTRTYSLKFPLTINIGTFDPRIVSESDYGVAPGIKSYLNITLSTGGMDDTFSVTKTGPAWVTAPERIITKGGEGRVLLEVNPSVSNVGSNDVEFTLVSETFPDYIVRKTISILVSAEANEILDKIEQYTGLLEEKKDKLSEQNYYKAKEYIDSAESYVEQGRYSSAKAELNRAENIIFSVSSGGGINFGIIIAIVIVAGAGVVFWKVLLPKIRGTNPAEVKDEEVI